MLYLFAICMVCVIWLNFMVISLSNKLKLESQMRKIQEKMIRKHIDIIMRKNNLKGINNK